MSTEGELALTLPAPEVSEAEIAELIAVLRAAGTWLTAREIAAKMGEDIDDRLVRKIASAARPAVVSFPGSKGYKAWELCTVEEASHCIETFQSQAREMMKSAVQYTQAYHRRFRGAARA